MANYKGSGVVFLRAFLQEHDACVHDAFLQKLPEEERIAFTTVVPSSWVPLALAAKYFELAAPLLGKSLRELGRLHAHDNLSGIYRALIRFTTPGFVISKAAKLWTTYYDEGTARVGERGGSDQEVTFIVDGCPGLSKTHRELIAGFVTGTMETTGVHGASTVVDERNPLSWRWCCTWSA